MTGFSKVAYQGDLTTAIFSLQGRAEHCSDINVLRSFRDNILACNPSWRPLVKGYYRQTRELGNWLNVYPDGMQLSHLLYRNYLQPCIRLIKAQRYHRALVLLRQMIEQCSLLLDRATQHGATAMVSVFSDEDLSDD